MRAGDDGDREVESEEGMVTGTGGLKPGRVKVTVHISGSNFGKKKKIAKSDW